MSTESQTSNAVLMVRPAAFGLNPETAATNTFACAVQYECAAAAAVEFDGVVDRLAAAGVDVIVLEDSREPPKPDAAFPNNWVSFHASGELVIYPMAAPTRRLERCPADLRKLLAKRGFEVRQVIDLSASERSGRFLEGTGSVVLDRPRRRAYAARGPRTDPNVLGDFEQSLGYSALVFDAFDRTGRPIYHTNVLMSVGTSFAILCTEVVRPEHRRALIEDIEASGRTIIHADYEQLRAFACNILELRSAGGDPLVALSTSAKASLHADQLATLERIGGELVDAAIPTIETVGGGSLRCMLAEVHLPQLH